jgi:single-strand DNA-binding protein
VLNCDTISNYDQVLLENSHRIFYWRVNMALNKVMLIGNLGRDPEIRYTQNQMAVCNLNLATGERKKDESGNWVEHTEWHRVVTYGKTAENCGQYLKKGRSVFVEGRLRTNKWKDKEGNDRYTTEIIANTVQFLGGKDASAGSDGPSDSYSGSNDNQPVDVTFEDDDIPF